MQSARFLTDRTANSLVESIKQLASAPERALLDKPMSVEGRIRTQKESALGRVGVIQQALRERRKVSFRYFDYDLELRAVPRKDDDAHDKTYVETPLKLVYSEGNYYLLAYNEKHKSIVTYRVDRMKSIKVLDEPATRNEAIATFDAAAYANRAFSMYSGKTTTATLVVHVSAMNAVVDRFGTDVAVYPRDDSTATVLAPVMDSPTFYGWVAQFGDKVRIEKPSELVEGFTRHLTSVLAAYGQSR